MEKERLFEENLLLKQAFNNLKTENTKLKTKLKTSNKELLKAEEHIM